MPGRPSPALIFASLCLAAGVWAQAPHNFELIGETVHDGVAIERFLYDGSTYNGEAQRVYALYAAPEGPGPHPAILQIHGGGQTCYPSNVAHFVGLGYACLSYDWTGPRDERPGDEVTHWAPELIGEYYEVPGQGVETSIIHHATNAGVAAIDILAARDEVDAARIGVQGVSWGGLLTFNVAARDDRLAAVVPVYGIGGVADAWNSMGIGLRNRGGDLPENWKEAFDPISFPGRITAPVFFCSGTNDFFGQLPDAEARLDALSVPVWRGYGPNRMHSLDPGNVRAAESWLDCLLKTGTEPPPPPALTVEANEDGSLRVSIDAPPNATQARVDYARGAEHALTAAWLSADAAPARGGAFAATVTLVDALEPVSLIGQVTFSNGATISSPVWTGVPARDVAGARGTEPVTPVLSDWGAPDGGWYVHSGVGFTHAVSPPGTLDRTTVDGREALLVRGARDGVMVGTRVVADSAREKGNGRALEIWLHDVDALQMRTNWFLRLPSERQHAVDLEGGEGWVRHVVEPGLLGDFTEGANTIDESERLASWNEVYALHMRLSPTEGGEPAVGRLAWIEIE